MKIVTRREYSKIVPHMVGLKFKFHMRWKILNPLNESTGIIRINQFDKI